MAHQQVMNQFCIGIIITGVLLLSLAAVIVIEVVVVVVGRPMQVISYLGLA